MLVRLTMVCSGISAAVRRGAFPRDEPLDARSLDRAPALAGLLGRADSIWTSPARGARQTAGALGLQAVDVAALRDQDFGCWAGRALAQVEMDEPEALGAWLGDPDTAPPGGESFADLARRVASLMDGMLGAPGRTVAFTHAPVVRAAILHAVGAPLGCARHIDVEPLSVTDIRSDGRRWVLRATGITAPKRKGAAEAEAGG